MITALLVSVNYSDYSEVVLPYNTKQFDQIIVLTIESDKTCQEVCSKYSNVKCLVFPDEILKKNGKTFNKGALINKGFEYLNEIGYSDWLVMTDSDIIFPENFKELMHSKEKDPNILYGMERRHCVNLNRFKRYMRDKKNINMQPKEKFHDYFMGYCQIFIYKDNRLKYDENCNAEDSDIIFLTNFSEEFKEFKEFKQFKQFKQFMSNRSVKGSTRRLHDKIKSINNFILLTTDDFVLHLGIQQLNWEGRTTPQFV